MAAIKRSASSHWSGDGKNGKGTITTQSGVLSNTPYSFSRRFGDEKGTNPEELIAAAHASCFTMALAFQLTGAGKPAESLDTSAVDLHREVFKIQRDAIVELRANQKISTELYQLLIADLDAEELRLHGRTIGQNSRCVKQ